MWAQLGHVPKLKRVFQLLIIVTFSYLRAQFSLYIGFGIYTFPSYQTKLIM